MCGFPASGFPTGFVVKLSVGPSLVIAAFASDARREASRQDFLVRRQVGVFDALSRLAMMIPSKRVML